MAIELRHLRYMIAVAESGQLTQAAARLHLAQPALSQSIRQVERELGTPLFDRHPRGVTLTAAGEVFLEHARAAVASSEAALTAARQTARAAADQLVLGFINGGLTLAEPLLNAFGAAHGEIVVVVREVSFAHQVDWLEDGTVDAMVMCPGPPFPKFECIPLSHTAPCVFIAESHRLALRTDLRFVDVADETYLRMAEGVPEWWADLWLLTAQRGRRPKTGRHSSGTVNESLAGVLSGEVVVIAPAFFIPPTPIPGVRAIPLRDVDPIAVELVYLRDRAARPTRQLADVARTLAPVEPAPVA
ncbi:MAG: LysR family transcriptional regulator, partial [Solirubrobacteraceae bacterium]